MRKALALFFIVLFLGAFTHGNKGAFTSAWQSIRTSGGGQIAVLHAYPDGTILAGGDTAGPWLYKPTGTATIDGTTYAAPAWQPLVTSDSLPAGDVTWANASSGNTGPVEFVAAPSNTNVLYTWILNKVYVSTNKGAKWNDTGLVVNYSTNGHLKNTDSIAVDPNNPDIVYVMTPNGTYGPSDASSGTVLVNTSGRSGTIWTPVSGLPAPSGAGTGCQNDATPCGGNIKFDPTSAVVGGVTQRVLFQIQGSTGIWESTNGGASFTHQNAGSPPTNSFNILVDKFGVVWLSEGFRGTAGRVYKYAASTWTLNTTLGVNGALIALLQDPNASGVQANNQLIGLDSNGQIFATVNNGVSWLPTLGGANQTIASSAPQAGWLGTAMQTSGGNPALNSGAYAIDPSGTIFAGTGIDIFTTPDPIVSGSLVSSNVWSANTIGIDQLVVYLIVSPPGSGPVICVWDRGCFPINNPDFFAPTQYPNKNTSSPTPKPITMGSGYDYVPGTPATQVAAIGESLANTYANLAKTTDGSNTYTPMTLPASGVDRGAVIAASAVATPLSTATNFCTVPGIRTGQNTAVYCTANGGTTWATGSFTGSPAAFISLNQALQRQPLAADRVTPGTYCIIDLNQKLFSTTNFGVNWAATGASLSGTGAVQADRLMAAPMLGSFNTAGHFFYLSETGALWKSTDTCVTWNKVPASGALDKLTAFGFGAPKPGGNGYPTIIAYQKDAGVNPQGFYQSTDGGATWTAVNIPASENLWPAHLIDLMSSLAGDSNVYGRFYAGLLGNTAFYIDAQDACPWVNLSNVNPNDPLTGTVTLTSKSSGRVPVSGVQYSLDGSNIGTQQTGSGPYSISWNASGVTPGAHTLKVTASGATCSGSFAIPITTSQLIANDNMPMWLNKAG